MSKIVLSTIEKVFMAAILKDNPVSEPNREQAHPILLIFLK